MHTNYCLNADMFESIDSRELEWTMIKLIYYGLGLMVLLIINWRLLFAKLGRPFRPITHRLFRRRREVQTPCEWKYECRTDVGTSNGTHEKMELRAQVATVEGELDRWRDNYAQWTKDIYEAESMMHGSEFRISKPSSCQANLYTKMCGKEVYIGVVFVMRCGPLQVLITAGHNIDVICGNWFVQGMGGVLRGEASAWKRLSNYDVAYKVLSLNEVSTLGLKTAKSGVIGQRDTPVVTCTASGIQSVGQLKTAESCGLLDYEGSTLKGFSGAPYVIGNTVYGVHVAGTKRANVGINANLISLLIQKLEAVQVESSEDFYVDEIHQMRKSGKFAWTYSHPMEHDEVIFMDRKGRFHTVDAEWFDTLDITDREKERGFKASGRLEKNQVVLKEQAVEVCVQTPCFWSYENDVGVYAESNMELEAAVNAMTQAKLPKRNMEVSVKPKTREMCTQTEKEPTTIVKAGECQTEIISDGNGSFLELTKESACVPDPIEQVLPGTDVQLLQSIQRNLRLTRQPCTDLSPNSATIGPVPTPAQRSVVSNSNSTKPSRSEELTTTLLLEMREMRRTWEEAMKKQKENTQEVSAPAKKKKVTKGQLKAQLKEKEMEIARLQLRAAVQLKPNGNA